MAVVKLSDAFVQSVRAAAAAQHRSVPKQIEYWAKIGRAAMDNPDLPVSFIIGLFEAMEEEKLGMANEEYKFG